MRLTKQDKINIYLLYQQGDPYSKVRQYYPIGESDFYYLVQIVNRYGVPWLDRPRHKWTKEKKLKSINRVLLNYESQIGGALDLELSSVGMLTNWIRDYRKNGYNVIDKPIGRPRKKTITKHNQKKSKEFAEKLLYLTKS